MKTRLGPVGLTLRFTADLVRHKVARCAYCGRRRVLYSLAVLGMVESDHLCAPCAGIRP